MAQRINITIRDDLHQAIQELKNKGVEMNISQTCNDAIDAVVKIEKSKILTDDEFERMVIRLNFEQQTEIDRDFTQGKEDGLKDARSLSYKDFCSIESLWESREDLMRGDQWVNCDSLDLSPNTMFKIEERLRDVQFDKQYLAGWVEGVLDVWDAIAKKINR